MYKRHSSAASSTNSQTDRLYDCLREEQHKSSKIAAKRFIETTLGYRLASDDFHKELQDGVLLCRLVNCLRPGTIKSVGEKNIPFVKMANIGLFLQGARELGLQNSELFQTVDLYEAKDMGAVINTILSLARLKANGRRHSSDTPSTNDHDKSHQYPQRTSPRLSNKEATSKSPGLAIRRSAGLPSKKSERQHHGTQGTDKSESRNGYRHVKSIFGQQLSTEEANKTCRANDVGRIAEKAEALRRTYRSNMHQRPTADSGYSTMALRSDDGWQYPEMSVSFPGSRTSSTSGSQGDDDLLITDFQEQSRQTLRLSTNSEASSSGNSSDAYSVHMEQHVSLHQNNKHYLDFSQNGYDDVDSFFARPTATRSLPIVYTKQNASSQEDVRVDGKSVVQTKYDRSESTSLDDIKKKETTTVILKREDGKQDAHYQLGNCIGKGQFGSVYRALDVHTGEIVAVKRIRIEDVSHDQEIMQEVDLLKGMNSPHVVRYLGSIRDENYLNIVLEYVENGSLLSTLKAFGSLPEKLVASYAHKILCGLKYLHEHEVAHCDLKAANILTTKTGEIKLTDFGVSLNLRIKQDALGAPAGTPNWMAPEVIELKGASTKSDIWSLGCTIVEMLTGKPPYADMIAMSALYHIVEDENPPLPPDISKNLEDFLRSCFRKDPASRPTAKALLSHPWIMHALSSNASPPLSPTSSLASSPRTSRQKMDYGDIDLSRIFEYVRSNPTMNSQRVPASEIRKKEFVEHQFVKTSFGKAITCKVCLITVKRHAAYCEACALICHDKCRKSAASCRPIYPNVTPKMHPQPRRDSYPLPTPTPAPTTRGNHSKFQKMLASCMKKPNQDQLSSECTKSYFSGDAALSVHFIDQSTAFRRRSTGTLVDAHPLPATGPKSHHPLDKKRTKSTHQDECVIS